MGDADLKIVAIALVFSATYGIFLFMHESVPLTTEPTGGYHINATDDLGFFDTLTSVGQMNDTHPEIFFINSIIFGVIAFMLIFIGMRFVRGTG